MGLFEKLNKALEKASNESDIDSFLKKNARGNLKRQLPSKHVFPAAVRSFSSTR